MADRRRWTRCCESLRHGIRQISGVWSSQLKIACPVNGFAIAIVVPHRKCEDPREIAFLKPRGARLMPRIALNPSFRTETILRSTAVCPALSQTLRIWGMFSLAFVLSAVCRSDDKVSTATPSVPTVGTTFDAGDTLALDGDSTTDGQACLAGLRWVPGKFDVQCETAQEGFGDLLLRFPSAISTGDPINDNVAMEWYVARDAEKRPIRARSVVVVHESGRGMTVGRIFARGLAAQGLHTLMVQLPGYGARRSELTGKPEMILSSMKQAVADVRRARDAAACLPLVDPTIIGVQGTSLGGFITCTTAGLDSGFDRVFILLAGGNLHDVVLKGAKDAAKVRERLESIGVDGDRVRELTRPVEPLRLAHRLKPETTWLYSGKYDDVVPPECSFALATAASLPAGHHVELLADHYSGIVFLPMVMVQIREHMSDGAESTAAPSANDESR